MTAVAEPQTRNQDHMADVVALPLPESYGFTTDPVEESDAPSEAGGWMKAVALASAKLEQLQWELDAAEEDLCAALRGASASSVSASALARTAGLTAGELEAYLQRPALADAAAVPGLAGPALPPLLGMQAQA
ncbi:MULTISPECIES: hypothetical protein [unclassified Pseudarthrobacter]|uniref:hypothetical protein n=1 Tax=unclassified Pseudarthrobacter TaxID=2647000 RepID=UPI00362AA2C0